jgi:hypothetical protein
MQAHSGNDTSGSHLEQYDDGDDAPTRQHPAGEAELDRYEDDEVVTAPWPPYQA